MDVADGVAIGDADLSTVLVGQGSLATVLEQKWGRRKLLLLRQAILVLLSSAVVLLATVMLL
jgi:hypothetical protein